MCCVHTYICAYVSPQRNGKKKLLLEYELKELNESLKKVETKINAVMEEKEDVIKEVEGQTGLT